MSPITSPVHTSVFIVALMVATGAGAWLLLSHGLRHTPLTPARARRWRWALALGLTGWLGGRLALSHNPPGPDLLATPYSFLSFAFLLGGLTAGVALLAASPTFRQVIRGMGARRTARPPSLSPSLRFRSCRDRLPGTSGPCRRPR